MLLLKLYIVRMECFRLKVVSSVARHVVCQLVLYIWSEWSLSRNSKLEVISGDELFYRDGYLRSEGF